MTDTDRAITLLLLEAPVTPEQAAEAQRVLRQRGAELNQHHHLLVQTPVMPLT